MSRAKTKPFIFIGAEAMQDCKQVTNNKIVELMAMGRGLLADCPVRPEIHEDHPEIFDCDAISETAEERAVALWRFL